MIQPVENASTGEWIGDGLLPHLSKIGAFIPVGFEAYARILHPAFEARPGVREPTVRWADIAAQSGVSLRKDTSWEELTDTSLGSWTPQHPDEGHLPRAEAEALVRLLRPMTATPDSCYFGVWEGWGGLDPDRRWPGVARLRLPHDRTYILLRGSIEAAAETFNPHFRTSANLWWPEDRSWLVATEIDHHWTYLAGSASCIARILADERLEVFAVDPHDQAVRFPRIADEELMGYESGGPIRAVARAFSRLSRRIR